MSISQNPMTGQMKKSMANFSTYTLKGQNIIRSKAFNRKDANTEAQQTHRSGFKLIVDEFRTLGGIVATGFPNRLITQSPYNAFMAANLPEAIDNSGEAPVIDYTQMVVTDGTYQGVIADGAVVTEAGNTVSFKTEPNVPGISATDKVTALAKTSNGALYLMNSVRGSGTTGEVKLNCPGVTEEEVVYIYLYVTSPNGAKVSKSVYVPLV
ncbi:MAG: DUF6266 family protein [Bacteroidota bacterium]|nr:DUF6266 family protein [Bacteroidota bacterium]